MKQEYEEYFNTFKGGYIVGALMIIIAGLLCLSLFGAILIVIGLIEWILYKILLGAAIVCIFFPLLTGLLILITEHKK